LAFGLLGLIAVGGLYGPQAEEERTKKKRLIAEREELVRTKAALITGGDDFEIIKSMVVDIRFRLVEIGAAVKNLEDVWILLESYAKSSLRKVESVSTRLAVKRFVSAFERVIAPWHSILGITRQVSVLFNEILLDDNKRAV
jgi:hypothetical protein